jgi:outer membrane lipoprotein SlyB
MGTKKSWLGAGILGLALVAGCASSKSGSVYTRDQARTAQTVELGQVVAVREVEIEGTKTPAGVLAGGVLGGVLGSMVGGGKGQTLGAVVGALGGAAGGAAAEEGLTRQKGLEITVKLERGEALAIVQGADEPFAVGDQVRVLRGPDGATRVTH